MKSLLMTIGSAVVVEPPLLTIGRALAALALEIKFPSPGLVLREVANLVAVILERPVPLPGLLKNGVVAAVLPSRVSANVVLPARKEGALLLKVLKKSVTVTAGFGSKILEEGAGTGLLELTSCPSTILSWRSFLAAEPFRPVAPLVSLLLPLMAVATNAAAAKHATIIFVGVERVVMLMVCMYVCMYA